MSPQSSAGGPPSPSSIGVPLLSRRQLLVLSGGAALLAACGQQDDVVSSSSASAPPTDPATTERLADTVPPVEAVEPTEPAVETTAVVEPAAPATTAPEVGGVVTFGSNYSDPSASTAMRAAIDSTGLDVEINTVDHNTYQQNFGTYVHQPDDVMCWFGGYRMRALAREGAVGDVSDVWAGLGDMSEGFKNAATLDGKQYLVPFSCYVWAIHYRTSLFAERGYRIPTTWDELKALCARMQADGITPFAAANDGTWPQMGMFDYLDLRTNGYDFHVSLLAGKEDWTGAQVRQVFANWSEILGYMQPDANSRTWQDATTALGAKECGMYLLGTFLTSNFDPSSDGAAQAIIDDIDFFAFPAINAEFGQDAVEAPTDGFMLAASPSNPDGAKALLLGLGQAAAIDAYASVDSSSIAANRAADPSRYDALQRRSAELVAGAKHISQFLDRDTDPDFAATVLGPAIASFIADPSSIDSILASVEAQRSSFTWE